LALVEISERLFVISLERFLRYSTDLFSTVILRFSELSLLSPLISSASSLRKGVPSPSSPASSQLNAVQVDRGGLGLWRLDERENWLIEGAKARDNLVPEFSSPREVGNSILFKSMLITEAKSRPK
jgi:hypothetical protein